MAGDIDNDGDLDLLVTNNGQTADLLRNDGGHRRGALSVRLVGRQSNRDGIGARVRATVGGRVQVREVKAGSSYLGQGDTRVHVGLGGAVGVERLEVRWPTGVTEVMTTAVAGGQIVTVTEGWASPRECRFPPDSYRGSRLSISPGEHMTKTTPVELHQVVAKGDPIPGNSAKVNASGH